MAEKEETSHQVHITLPIDVYNRLREILDGSPLSVLFRRLAIRYVEQFDTGKTTGSKVDRIALSVLKDDLEKCVVMKEEDNAG